MVAVGGSSLMLLGLLERPTRDLDIVALVEFGRHVKASPLPGPLVEAAADVGETLGLGDMWLNAGPSELLDLGLPAGFGERVEARRYGALTLRLASRADELLFSARWSITHDPSDLDP